MKLLVTALVVVWVLWLLFGRRRAPRPGARDGMAASRAGRASPEGMVVCAHCGVHVPASEALAAQGRDYCSLAHRDAGPAAP